jgi:Domain of unknown function (DUF4112)
VKEDGVGWRSECKRALSLVSPAGHEITALISGPFCTISIPGGSVTITNPEPKVIDFELLPEESKAEKTARAVPRLIALLMDDLFPVPGTRRRFGLNPVLDLIPAIGDASAAVVSAITLFVAARSRVPKVVITRMGLNILINALIGIIPGVGEVFAFWFRPSHRNYELLKKHAPSAGGSARPSTRSDAVFVFAIVAVVLSIFAVCVLAGLYVSWLLARELFGYR